MATAIGKNLGKFKQWTGEKLGKANKTECSDEFQRLELETDQRKDTFERLYNASEVYLRTLEKKKKGPEDKNKISPILSLAYSLVAQGQTLPHDSPYGQAMVKFGEAQEQIANNQLDYANKLREDYVSGLEAALNELKELQQSRKKLESRRLDYNAKLNTVQKAKKEKPELEEQMRAAELKFNESMDESYSKMVAISNAEEMYMGQLAKFYDCELEYFQRNVQILMDIREIFNESNYSKHYQTTRRSPSLALRGEHQVSRSKSHRVNLSPNYEDQEPSFSPPNRNPSGYNKAGYFDTVRTNSETSEEMMPTGGGGYSAPGRILTKTPSFGSDQHVPPLPQRGSQKELVRVLYDYDGDTTDELPIRKGDTVTVLDKIDEGWWIGEIVDEYGRRAGMFPSNYVEEIAPDLPPPASMPKRSYTTTAPQRAAAAPNSINRYNTLIPDSVPIQTEPSMQGESIGRRRQAPLPPHGSGGSNQISPGNTRSNPSEIRRPSIPFHSNANTLKAQAPSNSPFDDDNAGGIISCQECGCTDYKANVFKQNSCNNCFHTH